MPIPMDVMTGNGHFLKLETSMRREGWVSPLTRDPWAYRPMYHKIDVNLPIAVDNSWSNAIQGAGQATLWTGVPTDLPVGQWEIGGQGLNVNMWAFMVTRGWLERQQQEYVNSHRILPSRDWVAIGTTIANNAIEIAIHDRVLAGQSVGGNLTENGLFRAEDVTLIEESDNLYTLTGMQFYRRIVSYLQRFRLAGLIRSQNIRLLYPESLMEKFAEPLVEADTNTITRDTVGGRLTASQGGTPLFLASMHPILELDHNWLEDLGVNPPGTNKNRMILQCDLPTRRDELGNRNPVIWRGHRVIDRTNLDRNELEERFIVFAMQSEVCYDNTQLQLIIEFPKKP